MRRPSLRRALARPLRRALGRPSSAERGKLRGVRPDVALPFDMFDGDLSPEEARAARKLAGIYHKGQAKAWNGEEVLQGLLERHRGIQLPARTREAIVGLFSVILWGELAAWKVSADLARQLEPLEAKMAATSQAHDEARHFYVMYDYLELLGEVPTKLDYAPEQLLNMVLGTKVLAHKLLGMQLMVETLALTIFQTIRETAPEPVLAELMKYYEKDEARHVGLGMTYLPMVMASMSKIELGRLMVFQGKILAWALLEMRILQEPLKVLGIDARDVLERGRAKQIMVMRETFQTLGLPVERGPVIAALGIAGELVFPLEENKHDTRAKLRAAWDAARGIVPEPPEDELTMHDRHEIVTAQRKFSGLRSIGS